MRRQGERIRAASEPLVEYSVVKLIISTDITKLWQTNIYPKRKN